MEQQVRRWFFYLLTVRAVSCSGAVSKKRADKPMPTEVEIHHLLLTP